MAHKELAQRVVQNGEKRWVFSCWNLYFHESWALCHFATPDIFSFVYLCYRSSDNTVKYSFWKQDLCLFHLYSTVLSLNISSSLQSQILTIINQRHLRFLPSQISTVSGNYVISRFAAMALADKSIVIKRNVPDQSLLGCPSLICVK